MATMKTVLQNHLCEFDGQLYRQKEGGPIGENITQIAADLVMFKLMGGFKERLNLGPSSSSCMWMTSTRQESVSPLASNTRREHYMFQAKAGEDNPTRAQG